MYEILTIESRNSLKKVSKHKLIHLVIYFGGLSVLYLCIALISAVFFDVEITIEKLISQTFMLISFVAIIIALQRFIHSNTMKGILKIWRIAKKHFIAYYRNGSSYNRFMIIFYATCIIFLFIILSLTIVSRQLY